MATPHDDERHVIGEQSSPLLPSVYSAAGLYRDPEYNIILIRRIPNRGRL